MFNLFQEQYLHSTVPRHTYSDFFYSNFKLCFGLPRSDTCSTCDEYYVKLCTAECEEAKQRILSETTQHYMKVALGYWELQQDTEAAEILFLTFLFFTLIFCKFCYVLPFTIHECFYQRQLLSYNYQIHYAGANTATMMFWHEAFGNCGYTEIASFFLCYVEENYTPLREGEGRN
ncbi:hypothetical protein PR048_008994 [Dryococelus australis]|uniref:Uncharacterized protein n=1 Tax=Dryococelus australis TaxID=614101 RepID=A0ABQ9HZQ1_9NEOP|nr:hypothetical protein PR048_008994 [Dryococelus australis]